ncbi:Uncharacterised protein [Yersinia nurmii]|uniref:Uncharacterized protein n=1 Tax=Yersinia nurmii TaxID=685706 RepID=A0ABM9S639_9GAMM|nr:hypothetical protein [Yersinia nurmii]CNE27841.1 Uncharacterised protein [Yersinia nurmii]
MIALAVPAPKLEINLKEQSASNDVQTEKHNIGTTTISEVTTVTWHFYRLW